MSEIFAAQDSRKVHNEFQVNRLLALLLCAGVLIACSKKEHATTSVSVESPEMNQDEGSGGRVGNGGGGVICRTDDGTKIKSIEIFDFYEARALDPSLRFDVDLQPAFSSNLDQAIETARHVVETRIGSFDLVLRDYLLWRLGHLADEIIFSEQPLPWTNDIIPLRGMAKNCQQIQLAFTRQPDVLTPKKIHFWKLPFEHPKFSNTNRAALIIHELIYELTAMGGAKNSQGARAFVANVFSGKYSETFRVRKSYFDFAKTISMPWVGFGNLPVLLGDGDITPDFYPDNQSLKRGHIIPSQMVETPLGRLKIGCGVQFSLTGEPKSFSYALDSHGGDKPAQVSLKISSGHIESFEVAAGIKGYSHDVQHWSMNLNRYTCQASSDYALMSDLPFESQFFLKLDRALPVNENNHFFELDALVQTDVSIIDGQISGKTWNDQNGANIKFKSGEKCRVSSIGRDQIELQSCKVPLFENQRNWPLSIKSVSRSGESFLRVTLADDVNGSYLQSLTGDFHGKITLKPGSKATFDERGNLRQGVLVNITTPLCTNQPTLKLKEVDSQGTPLDFDKNGCVICMFQGNLESACERP